MAENKKTMEMLDDIYKHYKSLFALNSGNESVAISEVIAASISAETEFHDWGWRYILSVKNGTLTSSRFLTSAIERHWGRVRGYPPMIQVIPCPIHGVVHEFDCGTHRATAKPGSGKPRRRAPRTEIALSDPVKARERLEEKLREYHGQYNLQRSNNRTQQ